MYKKSSTEANKTTRTYMIIFSSFYVFQILANIILQIDNSYTFSKMLAITIFTSLNNYAFRKNMINNVSNHSFKNASNSAFRKMMNTMMMMRIMMRGPH